MRKALTKLRVSNHQLMIEKGRHTRLPIVDKRVCGMCNEIEDEEHFLINCKKNECLRKKLYQEIVKTCNRFNSLESKEKIITMMSQTDKCMTRHIAKFVQNSFQAIKCNTSGQK